MSHFLECETHNGTVLDVRDEFRVVACEACEFTHIVPVPTEHELEQIYRHDYYATEKPLYLQEHQADVDWWNLVYDERFDRLECLLPQDRRRILDVGSGPGYFLRRGKERGWNAVGIEPSRQAASHSRGLGLQIHEGFLDDTMAEQIGCFDVIYLHEVLEHIPDPVSLLRRAHRLLSPEGVLCVIVPNDFNPLQQALQQHFHYSSWWVAPPHHINYFNHDSLSSLIEKNGFALLHQTATFPLELFLLMGCNYVGNDSMGRQIHAYRKQLELRLEEAGLGPLKRDVYDTLVMHGLGREAVVFARVVKDARAKEWTS